MRSRLLGAACALAIGGSAGTASAATLVGTASGALELGAGDIYAAFTVVPGDTYEMQLFLSRPENIDMGIASYVIVDEYCGGAPGVDYCGGDELGELYSSNEVVGFLSSATSTGVAPTDGFVGTDYWHWTGTQALADINPNGGDGIPVDWTINVYNLTAVPEPGTWALSILGLMIAGMALRTCRRSLQLPG